MRAVRLVEARRLELVDIAAPDPAPGEVVVRVDGCGICGSDLTSYKAGLFAGTVPGHELAGTIDALGGGVGGWSAGDTVVVDTKTPCGVCADCRSGAATRCVTALTAGIGFGRDGGFAELVAVPAQLLHRVPAGLNLDDACLVEPLSVAIHGVQRAQVTAGDTVVVIGLGSVGLLTVAALGADGVSSIVAVDPVADRRRLALDLGAGNVLADVREVRGAIPPAPVVMECSGDPRVLHAAADLVAPGGRMVMLGVPFGEATVIPLMWVTREITITGSIASGSADFTAAIELLSAQPGVARMVTRRASLPEVPDAFEALISPTAGGKTVVDPRR